MSDGTTASTNVSAAASSATPSTTTIGANPPSKAADATALQMGIMILVLGSSAGMVFYTKRTGSMLRSINKISEKQLYINKTDLHKFGPATKQEADKMRSRIEKDEFF